jgi:hypothetical protein
MLHDRPSHPYQKVLAITRASTILHSVVEVNIGEKIEHILSRSGTSSIQYTFSPALRTLARAIPAMGQLHTVHLSRILLAGNNLYYILSSPSLVHLILDSMHVPKFRGFPPAWRPKLRKLTLTAMWAWETLEPFIAQLAPSLEYLEFQDCELGLHDQFQLPSFPCLCELRHYHDYYIDWFNDNEFVLNELFRLSQITHLRLTGRLNHQHTVALPDSLQHLSTDEGLLVGSRFGTGPFPRVRSLSIRCQTSELNSHITLVSFVRDRFPRGYIPPP